MLTKTLSEAKKKQRNILIKAMNNDIGSIDSAKDSWNPAQISERAKDISYIRSLVDSWNPAQLNEALRMLDLPVIDTWNPAQIEEQRRNIVFYLAERTLTGNPIILKILGNITPEVTGIKVTMNPIQSGTGDPSPTNIRPISGRTEVSVKRTGKNLFDKNAITDGSWLSTTTGEIETSSSTTNYVVSDFIPVLANKPIYIPASSSARRWFYDSNKNPVTYLNNSGNQAYTPTNSGYIRITINKTQISLDTYQVEQGSTATAYEPYTAETHTKEFGQTVYGGNYDALSGKLSITHILVNLDGNSWFNTTGQVFSKEISSYGNVVNFSAIFEQFKKVNKPYASMLEGEAFVYYNFVSICIPSVYANVGEYVSANGNSKLAYQLATPTTIETSEEEITLLKGTNVLSTDGDSIELKYKQNF